MITDVEKLRIKAFLLQKGIESEFVGTNHIAVLFRSTDPFSKTVPKVWEFEFYSTERFRVLKAEDITGCSFIYGRIDEPIQLYQTLEQAIRAMIRDYKFKT
jgi:hypothetical protein